MFDRDETIHQIISDCCKLAPKVYKSRYDFVQKVIYWEFRKKFKSDHMNKVTVIPIVIGAFRTII